MNRVEAASPPLFPPARRRTRLRARPSGLKGHCRDRYATGLRPALDPGASTAPQHAAARAGAGAARRARGTEHKTKIKSLQPSLYGFRGLPALDLAGVELPSIRAVVDDVIGWAKGYHSTA
jgi:hypothetical protein